MDAATRKAVEERAYALWDEAGRPDGSALLYWLRAEQEFGIVPRVEPDDSLVTLQELAAEAGALGGSEAAPADGPPRDPVDEAVPIGERLPGAAGENPTSEQVESIARGRAPPPGATAVEGRNNLPPTGEEAAAGAAAPARVAGRVPSV